MAENVSAHLMALETALLGSSRRVDATWLAEVLADDFVEFGASGRTYDKASVMAALTAAPAGAGRAGTIEAFAIRLLAPGVALVTYEAAPPRSLRSSVWRLNGERWRLVFHQGTPAAE